MATVSMPVGVSTPHHLDLVRSGLLLGAIFASAWAGLWMEDGAGLDHTIWPAGGLAAGLYLTTPRSRRPAMLGLLLAVVTAAHLLTGHDVEVAVGLGASCAASAWVLRNMLVRGLDGRRAALLDEGDVSRLIGAVTVSSLAAGVGYGVTDLLSGNEAPLLGVLGAFGAYAAAQMILLPLFLRTLDFEPLAGPAERATQSVILIGTTILVFWSSDAPVVIFAVMPMFAWYAYRGTLREATYLLALVGFVGTIMTMAGMGPIAGLYARYDLPPELIGGVLQLFLLDCALILLPLSVMTTQQRMSAGRADSESRAMRQLVTSARGTAIIATDRGGLVEVFNPAAEQMFGWTAAEMQGQSLDRLFSTAELAVQGDVAGALARHRDGTERTLDLTLSELTDEMGEHRGHLVTAEDVTERAAAHRALLSTLEHQQLAVEQLRELEQVKGEFVATVSHELRTPITNILGYTEVLEDGMVGELSARQREIIGRVERNGHRLLLLVEDLLALSEIESASVQIEPAATDLVEVVVAARQDIAEALDNRHLAVSLRLPAERADIRGDALQLQRMIRHLLSNAVKFTEDGGAIEIALESQSDAWVVSVSDSGVGIPEKEQDRLFTRFYRSHTAFGQAIQGAGLGLTIVQSIVAGHGGTVSLSSSVGEGTTVEVTLPRAPAVEPVG